MSTLELLDQLKQKEKTQKEEACREVAASCNGHTKIIVEPIGNAAHSIAHLRLPQEEILRNLSDVTFAIAQQTHELKNGDISKIEEMLYSQALTLNAAFHKFLMIAAGGTGQGALTHQRFELITGLAAMALKAQEQSRKTLATLAEMKLPKRSTTFVKQYVNQQLNQALIQQNETELSTPSQLQENSRASLDIRSKRETAAKIQQWKPWENSSGPKSEAGKEISSHNALRHGIRSSEYSEYRAAITKAKRLCNEALADFTLIEFAKKY